MTALTLSLLLAANPLVPEVTSAPPLVTESSTLEMRGVPRLATGFAIGTLGTSVAIASGLALALIGGSGCRGPDSCWHGLEIVLPILPLILGATLASISIPLVVRGFWERHTEAD